MEKDPPFNHSSQQNKIKNIDFRSQKKTLFKFLQDYTATASMVSAATGIPQKNICRFKRKMEDAGLLWEVRKAPCKITNFSAWYLTTDPAKTPQNKNHRLWKSSK